MKRLVKSFKAAFNGLKLLIKYEQNFRIHLFFMALVITSGAFFEISILEWAIVLVCIAFALTVEGINTVVEYLCDLYSESYNVKIKKIKDLSAAVVLLNTF